MLVFWDNRKKTRIMSNQLMLLQEGAESKKEIREAIRVIDNIHEKITKMVTATYDWGDLGIVYLRLLEKLHDSGNPIITWEVSIYSIFEHKLSDFRSFDSFRNFFEKSAFEIELRALKKPYFRFKSMPDVDIDYIYVGEYVEDLYSILEMHKQLKNTEKIVNVYDQYVIPDILEIYLEMLKSFYDTIKRKTKLTISSKIKTEQMSDYVLKIVAFDLWKNCVSSMQNDVMPRLYEIKRQMLRSL